MNKPPNLTPTSYALLGLLARNPQSAYELNALMQTSLIRVFWPRVESHVYTEPKKLLQHKLVSRQKETLNGRNRMVYTITAKGKTALQAWLSSDVEVNLTMQAEFMLKLLLADAGNVADVHNTLEKSLRASRADLKLAIAGIREILSHEGRAQAGTPYNGIGINLMADILIARYHWGHYAQQATLEVDDEMSVSDKVALGRSAYTDALEKMEEALR